MSNATRKTTFWNFIQNNKIEIPIIQRDYAQGRKGKEALRKKFIADLKGALDSNENEPLVLDFVYGSVKNGSLNPLDGQQRLTTLWLFHWYIAYRAGKLNEVLDKENNKVKDILKIFTYETRLSSRDFIDKLCDYSAVLKGCGLVKDIQNQTWFYSEWKQDPTIQSILSILGGNGKDSNDGDNFESLFKGVCDFERYWEALTNKEKIVFYYLPLENFGLSDDLYIKMNARGKPLTSFENLKADLVGYIRAKAEETENKNQKSWRGLCDQKDGIPIKLDTTWMDIFWKNRSSDEDDARVDEIYFAFLNRFFWNELFIAKKDNEYLLKVGSATEKDGAENSTVEKKNPSYSYLNGEGAAYSNFDVYRYYNNEIPIETFNKIEKILDNYKAFIDNKGEIPTCLWNKDFYFIPKYKEDNNKPIEIVDNNGNKIYQVTPLTQVQRIAFFAICKFFNELDNGSIENNIDNIKIKLKHWMRVVWNLISGEDAEGGAQIRNTQSIRTAIEFIDSIDSQDVYKSLKDYNLELDKSDFFGERCSEEKEKATQIILNSHKTWEDKIIEAEQYAFFKGAIRFLFRNEEGKWNWDNFDTKLRNVKEFFDENGVKNSCRKYKDESILLKAVLYHVGNYEEEIESKKYVLDNTKSKWQNNILLNKNWVWATHNILMGNLDISIRDGDCVLYKSLYSSNLLDYIANEQVGSRINKIHEHLAIYKPYIEGMMPDTEDFHRNKVLSCLCNENIISSDQRIKIYDRYIDFFKGWDIVFTCGNKKYEWNTDDKIYLIDKDKPRKEILNTKLNDKLGKTSWQICQELRENLKNNLE
ncbi:MAG: DUF262 domain-containing protein [Opitutales bacterium]|nr:DUF262 domain-containing protein [Opitutales bacterium]